MKIPSFRKQSGKTPARRPTSTYKDYVNITETQAFQKLRQYDDAFYNTEKPLVSDDVYNEFRKHAKNRWPRNPYFKTVGAPPKAKRGEAVELPLMLTRMSRIRPDSVNAWAASVDERLPYVYYSNKIDGVFCGLHYRRSELVQAFTRGDGKTGQDVTRFIKHIKSAPRKLVIPMEDLAKVSSERPEAPIGGDVILTTELCVTWDNFEAYNRKLRAKKQDEFASPRVMALAAINRNEPDMELLKYVDCIGHGMVVPEPTNPERAQQLLKALFTIHADQGKRPLGPNTGRELGNLFKSAKESSPYPIDGFVLQATDGGIIYSIAMKQDADKQTIGKTEITDITVSMSMRNLAKPVINIKPVMIDGYKISQLTGHNMFEVQTLRLGVGSKVNVVRSGDVIPHMLKTGAHAPTPAKKPYLLTKCIDCGGKLSWTMTARGEAGADLQCTDIVCRESKRTAVFMDRMGIKGIGDAHIETLTYDRTVADVLAADDKAFTEDLGKIGPEIRKLLHKSMHCDMAKIMYASGIFATGTQSLGVSTLSEILATLKQCNITPTNLIHGRGSEYDPATIEVHLPPKQTSRIFISKLPEFIEFYKPIEMYHHAPVTSNRLAGYTFTFTGFRESNMADDIRRLGGAYADSLSKKTTHLVVLNYPEPAKAEKARKYGTKLLKAQHLKQIMQGYDSVEFHEYSIDGKHNSGSKAFNDSGSAPLKSKRLPPPFAGGSEEQWPSAQRRMRNYARGVKDTGKVPSQKVGGLLAKLRAKRR